MASIPFGKIIGLFFLLIIPVCIGLFIWLGWTFVSGLLAGLMNFGGNLIGAPLDVGSSMLEKVPIVGSFF